MPYINGNEVFLAADITNSQDSSGGSVEIVDNLTSYDTDKALSANQGREINEKIGDIETALDGIIAIQNELIGGGA